MNSVFFELSLLNSFSKESANSYADVVFRLFLLMFSMIPSVT